MEEFKSLHVLNPNLMKEMFNINKLTYVLRDSNSIYQTVLENVTYPSNTLQYYGKHTRNLLPNEIKESVDILDILIGQTVLD